MKCVMCGSENNFKSERRNVPYDSLPGVTLTGLEVSKCLDCGEEYTAYPPLNQLSRCLTSLLLSKRTRLAPAEIRFLRKSVGWGQDDMAELMGVAVESVSRWENGRIGMTNSADTLLRALVHMTEPIESYSVELLRGISDKVTPIKVDLSHDGGRFRATMLSAE